MRIFLAILIIICGSISVAMQFRDRKEEGLLVDAYVVGPAFFWLTIFSVAALLLYIILRKQRRNIVLGYLPALVGIIFITLVITHRKQRKNIDAKESILIAWTNEIGTDGGFTLTLKKDGFLTGRKVDRFSTTHYWGTFKQDGNYYLLNAPFDFHLGKKAYVDGKFLRFEGDTLEFEVYFTP